MNTLYLKLLVKIQNLTMQEEGQDLVEYALLIALISTAVVAGATKLAAAITSQFNTIATTIS
jgi:pilus assembly protein Flp/PilA